MRTIVDIPESSLAALDDLARAKGQSRAAAVRHAINDYVEANKRAARNVILQQIFDSLEPGAYGEDGVVYQQRIRAEWDGR